MKPKVKTALILGLAITIFLFVAGLFNASHHFSVLNVLGIFLSSLIGAAAGSSIFLWLTSWYSGSLKSLKINLVQDERLILDSLAIYSKHPFGSEGKLFLTDQRLVFRPGKFDFRKKEITIKLFEISDLHRCKAFGFLNGVFTNSGILVQTQGSSKAKFIVELADSWFEQIKSRK